MAQSAYYETPFQIEGGPDIGLLPEDLGRIMGPVMAGARARGVADAFELMEIAAVMIDGAGRVLHAGGRVERALRPFVRITEGHLVGADAAANDVLQRVVESGLRAASDLSSPTEFRLFDRDGRARLALRALRFPADDHRSVQLLRAIIIVTEPVA